MMAIYWHKMELESNLDISSGIEGFIYTIIHGNDCYYIQALLGYRISGTDHRSCSNFNWNASVVMKNGRPFLPPEFGWHLIGEPLAEYQLLTMIFNAEKLFSNGKIKAFFEYIKGCLLYTSDAADD